jgi:hypothetical protein
MSSDFASCLKHKLPVKRKFRLIPHRFGGYSLHTLQNPLPNTTMVL